MNQWCDEFLGLFRLGFPESTIKSEDDMSAKPKEVANPFLSEQKPGPLPAPSGVSPQDEGDIIFSGVQALNRARKKLSPVGRIKLLKACTDLFGGT